MLQRGWISQTQKDKYMIPLIWEIIIILDKFHRDKIERCRQGWEEGVMGVPV